MSQGDLYDYAGLRGDLSSFNVQDLLAGGEGYAVGPERALLSALLFDGIQSFIAYALARGAKERCTFSEAYRWVTDPGSDYTFSFNNVCEALGVNPEYLRYGLLNASNSLLSEVSKTRRNA